MSKKPPQPEEAQLKTVPARLVFSHVKAAREALQSKTEKWAKDYDRVLELAIKNGDAEAAFKALQWIMLHVRDTDGSSIVDQDVDKPKLDAASTTPTIKIGFNLGGLPNPAQPKQLPPSVEVVEIKPEPEKESV